MLFKNEPQGPEKLFVEQLIAGRDGIVDELAEFMNEGCCGHEQLGALFAWSTTRVGWWLGEMLAQPIDTRARQSEFFCEHGT